MYDRQTFNVGVPAAATLEGYCKARIKMLERDFRIYLTDEEKAHMNELKTEIEIDNFYITKIRNSYN